MFDCDNDPRTLQKELEFFIERWHGNHHPWHGIHPDKLKQVKLPQPLKWLYGYLGNWHGDGYWNSVLGHQDRLLHFEELRMDNKKLFFACENQGAWTVGTETSGEDPSVWVSIDDGPWQLLDNSLTRFLVTFVLHELVFESRYKSSKDGLIESFTDNGLHVSPLWINHPYPHGVGGKLFTEVSFHIADGRYLIFNDSWCGTSIEAPWETLPSIFKQTTDPLRIEGFSRYEPFPMGVNVPDSIRKHWIERLLLLHEKEVKIHTERCQKLREMLSKCE